MSKVARMKSAIEALLFISGEGISVKEIASGLKEEESEVQMILDTLLDDYLERDGGIIIVQTGNKYSFKTKPQVYPDIQLFLKEKKKETLSTAMLETLAIVAYNQHLTLFDIEEIRGVNSRALVSALLQKNLIKNVGRKEAPGRPMLYATTKDFLEYFGLQSLEELPSLQEVKEFNFDEL